MFHNDNIYRMQKSKFGQNVCRVLKIKLQKCVAKKVQVVSPRDWCKGLGFYTYISLIYDLRSVLVTATYKE